MVRFHWHVEGGQSAFIPPAGVRMDEEAGICHLSCEMELAGQNETCTSMLTVPAAYLDSSCIQPIGILLAHGLEAGDWDSPLMRGLVCRFAAAGHIVMRYHCRQKEARRQRILERALESAALSPLALATVQQWVIIGFDNGARVAASVAAKTRIRIGGYVALSYPLLEPAPPPPKARAGAPPPSDSEGPLLRLAEALNPPMLFVVGGRDARCPPERLGALFAPGGPAAGTDARAVVLQGLGPSLESGAGEGLEAVQRVVQPVAEFVAALERGGEAGEAATVKECGLAPAASLAPAKPQDAIKEVNPRLIILSGGPNSVHAEGSPLLPPEFYTYCQSSGIPLLGICYGMQLLVHQLGGVVQTVVDSGEYGRMPVNVDRDSVLYSGEEADRQLVWMSHGDSATALPEGFRAVAKSEQGACVAIEDPTRKFFGLQYHPEVVHSERGAAMIKHLLFEVAGLKGDWNMADVLQEEMAKVTAAVGPTDHVICALSGGVDSTVAATLVHRVLGDRLHCVFVDNGLLRHAEAERVMDTFNAHLHLPVTKIDVSARMLARLAGVMDPEAKRKAIGKEFIDTFQEYAGGLEAELGHAPRFLVQGTLYPDVIESCPPPGSGQKHSHTIKSHHNVGGLPEDLRFTLIEPLRELFKDEVRALGRLLEVPERFIARHPFPGPGLAVRVLGDVTAGDALATLREVDEVYVNAIREWGLYNEIWQAFAVFLPIRSVGVQGDQRTHSHVVALRAVTSSDGMTADWYPFQPDFLRHVSTKICNSVRGVNRVVYDVTSKPPSTIEWE